MSWWVWLVCLGVVVSALGALALQLRALLRHVRAVRARNRDGTARLAEVVALVQAEAAAAQEGLERLSRRSDDAGGPPEDPGRGHRRGDAPTGRLRP